MDRLSNNLSQVNINGIVLQTGSSSTPPSAPVSIADIISSDGFSETAYNEFDAKTLSNLWSVSKKLRGELSYFYKHILNEKYKRGIADINPNLEFYSTFKACCIRNPQEKALEIKQRYDQFVLESKQRGLFKILNDLKGRDNFQAVCALLKKESQYVLKPDIEKWERAQREPDFKDALEIKQRYDQFVPESKQRELFKILNDLKGRDNFQAVCALLKKESQYVLKLDIEKWERAQREPS